MKRGKLMMITVAVILPAAAVYAQVALPCYKTIMKSCGAIWANPGRVCFIYGTAYPCGDLIVQDGMVEDVKTAKTGQKNIVTAGSPVEIQIHVFGCEFGSNNCIDHGIQDFECRGRTSNGPKCGATGIPL